MPKIKLTHRSIPNLAAGKWLTDYMDETLTGFGVRVHLNGKKVFFVRYTAKDGRRRRFKIGPFPALSLAQARDHAKEIIGRIARGEDPQAEKAADRQAITFRKLASEYLEIHAKRRKRSWHEDERIIRADLLPVWKQRKAKDIGRRDVSELLDGIVNRGSPTMANRVRAATSKIFNFGISRDLVEYNPCFGVPMPSKAQQRDRVLDAEEIRRFWQALDSVDPILATTFKLRLLTAQRGIEVLSMRWEHIRDHWWTIPAGVAKNNLTHRVPLSPPALQLLEQVRDLTGSSVWVFASPRKKGSHLKTVTRATHRIAVAAKIKDFNAHDLRRTAASLMTGMGIPRLVVAKILNHAETGITAVYDRHSYDAEKRDALNRWAEKLEMILAS